MSRRFLGLDVGTQSTKALVIDLDAGAVVARAAAPHPPLAASPAGRAEQDPALWWTAVVRVAAELRAQDALAGLAGLGVSGQQHGFVPLDAEGQVIRPAKLWCDTETAAEARELGVPAGFTASKILWLKRHEPEHFARLRQVLLPHDWIDLRLTGSAWMEAGDASGTGLFDPRTRAFDAGAVEAIDPGLGAWLPPLVAPDRPAGHVCPAAAAELGLPVGLPVAPGAGDNMASAIGAGAVEPGLCVVSLGTSGTVFAHADAPVVDPEGLIAPFCDSTGGWLPLLCTMNATGVTDEVRASSGRSHAELTRAAREVPVGSDGLLWLPFLRGERVPDLPQATGTLLGMRPGALDPARLYRAALEGTTLNLGWGLDRLRALGVEPRSLRLVGGGSDNRLWAELLAAVGGVPVERLVEPESAALGAALQAAWVVEGGDLRSIAAPFARTDGAPIEPEAPVVAAYAALGERFRSEVARLYGR